MASVSRDNFGLLIAYLIPGFILLWGINPYSSTLQAWLGASASDAPTLGGFLYITIASLTAGLLISTIRWAVIDTLHGWTGIRQPEWNFSRLRESVAAYDVINELHYKYYQHNSGMLIVVPALYLIHRVKGGAGFLPLVWTEMGFILLVILFWCASRDTLRKYYSRVEQLLAMSEKRTEETGQGTQFNPTSVANSDSETP